MESTNISWSTEERAGRRERSSFIRHSIRWPAIACRQDVQCSRMRGRPEESDSVDQASMTLSPLGERRGNLSSARSESPYPMN